MRLPYFLFIMLIFFSCRQKDCVAYEKIEKKLMGVWYKKPIRPGEGWKLLNTDYISKNDSFPLNKCSSKFYVLHYLVADCDKCINDLIRAKKFIEENKQKFPNLRYVFVATGPTDTYIRTAIQNTEFEFPVYYENKYYSFKAVNGFPLDDDLNNTILINNKGEMILFGSFYDNEKAQELIMGISNCQ